MTPGENSRVRANWRAASSRTATIPTATAAPAAWSQGLFQREVPEEPEAEPAAAQGGQQEGAQRVCVGQSEPARPVCGLSIVGIGTGQAVTPEATAKLRRQQRPVLVKRAQRGGPHRVKVAADAFFTAKDDGQRLIDARVARGGSQPHPQGRGLEFAEALVEPADPVQEVPAHHDRRATAGDGRVLGKNRGKNLRAPAGTTPDVEQPAVTVLD